MKKFKSFPIGDRNFSQTSSWETRCEQTFAVKLEVEKTLHARELCERAGCRLDGIVCSGLELIGAKLRS